MDNRSCFIEGCTQSKQKNTSFHLFPADPELRNSWCQSIQTLNGQQNAFTILSRSYVCGHHFAAGDKCIFGKKTMLNKNVVPSVFQKQCETENSEQEIQNEPAVVAAKDQLSEENNPNEQSSCTSSDAEDFLGFDVEVINNVGTGGVASSQQNVEVDNVVSHANSSDSTEVDDEIIFVENKVEVIEIDDDDDDNDEIPPAEPIKTVKLLSKYDVQQMVMAQHPDVQLLKPKLDWKSDQFRLVYINGQRQNLCACIKCWELFEEINIDTVVRHARCNPTPNVSPCTKRRKMFDPQEISTDITETSIQSLTASKIQTIAACMDVQSSAFYRTKRFLDYAQFLIDTGASASKNKFAYEPNYETLSLLRDEMKEGQLSKISSIFNNLTIDFTLSCEVWQDDFRQKTNVELDVHYLDKNFQLHRIVVGARTMNGTNIDDSAICDQIKEILKTFSPQDDGVEFLQKATAFVTSRKLDTQSLGIDYFPSASSIINEIADGIVNEPRLKVAEKCLHILGWLNAVSTEKITEFDASKWQNIFELFMRFSKAKTVITEQAAETTFPQDYSMLQLLEPFHSAILKLSESKNNITKVFGTYKSLESKLLELACDNKEIVKYVKRKALPSLRTAFADSDTYQICMFLDPSNRDQFNALESDKIDSLQSKIDLMINSYTSSTKGNGCVENDLIRYMDDDVTSRQNQIDLFLQSSIPTTDDPYEFWRNNHNQQLAGLKALARKYFTIPAYVALSECRFSGNAKDFLMKRKTLEVKDVETMLIMNSSRLDGIEN